MSRIRYSPFIHQAPAPVEASWARPGMGCVFMCGWPWAMHPEPRPVPLAAPVPAPPRYGGRSVHVNDATARQRAPWHAVPESFCGRLGWTVPHSHSGCNAPRHHLLRYAARLPFADAVGPLVSGAWRSCCSMLLAEVLVARFVPVDVVAVLEIGPRWAAEAAASGMELPPGTPSA